MNALVSLVVNFRVTAPATVPAYLGPACQAWFLERLASADPELAQRLHAGSRRRPYTVSSLQEGGAPRQGRIRLAADQRVWLRITSLDSQLSRVLLDNVIPPPAAIVSLTGAKLAVEGITANPADHPWAASQDYEALMDAHLVDAKRPDRAVALHFVSPTTFRRTGSVFAGKRVKDHNQLMPLPELVFGSLADAWQLFGPVSLGDDLRAFAATCLAAERYRLETALVDDGRSRQAGVMGHCKYTSLADDPRRLRVLHLLSSFSLFCGTGWGTTAGWGQTRAARSKDRS